jgi:hypothetical protein
MIKIALNLGDVATVYTLIDNVDWPLVKRYRWRVEYIRSCFRAFTYIRVSGKTKTLYLHRLLMNPPKELVVDHINGDSLDNRRKNLRVCTTQQNSMNQGKKNKNTSSKYKGVCWIKRDKRWMAAIRAENRKINLGYYKDELEAVKAYNKAAKKYFGEFARLNVIK